MPDDDDNACRKCGEDKGPTRVRSHTCRDCDSRKARAQRKASRRLTISLPIDVWDRLDAEATKHGSRAGGYLQDLVIARDTKKQAKKGL